MSSDGSIPFKAVLLRGAVALALVSGLSTSFGATAGDHYIPLTKIFPDGKCSSVIPNFELMISQFAGGELTEHKIHNASPSIQGASAGTGLAAVCSAPSTMFRTGLVSTMSPTSTTVIRVEPLATLTLKMLAD